MEEQYDDADGYTEADVLTAARLGAYEERERSVRTLLALAAAHDLPAASVLKAFDESKVNRDHGKFSSKPGASGSGAGSKPDDSDHPIQGKTHAEQVAAIQKKLRGGGRDPLGHFGDWPNGVPEEMGDDVLGAMGRHALAVGVGPMLNHLYPPIAEKYGVSKHQFLQAVGALHKAGKLKLTGWAKTMHELPDPQLAMYAHGGSAETGTTFTSLTNVTPVQSGNIALNESLAALGDKSLNTAHPTVQAKYGAKGDAAAPVPVAKEEPPHPLARFDKEAALYAKKVADGETAAAKNLVNFVAQAHKVPKEQVLAYFQSKIKKALSGTGAAPTDPPVDDDDDTGADDTDDFVEAAFQLAEEAAEAGEDATDVLELLASRVGSIGKAWDEAKHKRDHGKFSSAGGSGRTKTGKEAGPKKPTKTEQKLQRRAEAKAAAHAHLKARASGKVLNASEAADLIGHLAHLTHADLRELRKTHGASFGGERRKGLRVQSLVKWAKNEIGKKRRAQQGSALQQVVDYGGIDPNSVDFKRFYGSMKDAVNDGIPMAAFKRGGNGLDEIAAQMVSAGHINLPDWEDPSEHLMGLLRGRKMLNWGNEDKKHADAYAEHVAGQLDADAGATFDPNKEWDDEDPDWFSKAIEPHADATDAERLAAAVEVALAALDDGTDPDEALERLHTHGTVEKAEWSSDKHPRDDAANLANEMLAEMGL